MKILIIIILIAHSFQAFAQQSLPITIKENFFNNYTYSMNKEKIRWNQVKSSLEEYPETMKKFLVGRQNITIGSGMRVATAILLTSGLVYFIADDYSIRSRNYFLGASTAGTVLGIIGPGIKEEGKRNISDAIQEYNYQILRNPGIPINQKSLEARNPYSVKWIFNF
ncbi:hypothetical protein [Algoriphagus sp.]|uniref:hypothetical protein n=1 Tax=Algoriphagus sp. TaxID=1872435 RepID=UPI0039195236